MGLKKDEEDLLVLLKKISVDKKDFREFSGTIGELEVCKEFGYTWVPTEGYDAWDVENEEKIQIKTRRLHTSSNFGSGRIGRFGRKNTYGFDIGILVQLNEEFEMFRVWKLDKKSIKHLEKKEISGVTGRLLGLHVSTFICEVEPIFPKA